MASSRRERRGPSRWIVWPAGILVVLLAAYCAGWFYFAHRLETGVETALARMNEAGLNAECTNASAGGFPLSIGLTCDTIAYADARNGVSVKTGAFRSSAPVYRLAHIVGHLDSPATITARPLDAFRIAWDDLKADIRLGAPLPKRLSVEGRAVTINGPDDGPSIVTADRAELHAEPQNRNLDIATAFAGLSLNPALLSGRKVPPLDGRATVTIDDGVPLAMNPPKTLRGQSATIRTLSLSTGEDTGITLSGPVSVGEKGLVNGQLTITIRNPKAVGDALSAAFPKARETLGSAFSTVAALGDAPELRLRIVDGKAFLGFIPLGTIPPL